MIAHRHAKTGEPIWIPVPAELKPLLDAAKAQRGAAVQIVTNIRGLPFTESGFRASLLKLVHALKAAKKVQPGLTFHGPRHTVATRPAEAGADNRTIMAVTGHTSEQMVATYTRAADRKRRATEAVRLLEGNEPESPS